jgi:hypothetical protein
MIKNRILCVGDSLALPRNGIPYESTWVYLLQQQLAKYEIINRSLRAMTTANLYGSNPGDFLEFYSPELLIVQLGIVDCAPRYLPRNSVLQKLLNSSPSTISNTFWKFFKKYRNRKPDYADVLPTQFKSNLSAYFDRCILCGVKKIIIILIGMPGTPMVKQTPLIKSQVKKYNDIYRQLLSTYSIMQLIDPLGEGKDDYFIEDGYHINLKGADKIATELFNVISN